jgi:large subunit ribosomal protein L25
MAKEVINLAAEKRALGTRANRRLRRGGHLPAVIYGHKQDNVAVAVPAKSLRDSLKKGAHVFELGMGESKETVLIKDVQYDHLGTEIIHVDFYRVDLNERVTVTVAVELKGTPAGAEQGGKLQQIMGEIEVECVVTDIPDAIVYNVSSMKLDDALHVRELMMPTGVKAVSNADAVVAVVHAIKETEVVALPTEAATTEPEVIKKERAAEEKKEDEKK